MGNGIILLLEMISHPLIKIKHGLESKIQNKNTI